MTPVRSIPPASVPKLMDADTNNLLTLLTQLYYDAEVMEKVVVIKADHFTWYGTAVQHTLKLIYRPLGRTFGNQCFQTSIVSSFHQVPVDLTILR